MKRRTREWVRKAEGDYLAVRKLARGSEPAHDATCFHCQQGAEKYLKAILTEVARSREHTISSPCCTYCCHITAHSVACGEVCISSLGSPWTPAIRATTPSSARPWPPSVGPAECVMLVA